MVPTHSTPSPRPTRAGRGAQLFAGAALLTISVLALAQGAGGCRASRPDTSLPPDAITIDLDVVPLMIPADPADSATVWVTVMQGSQPVSDSTLVSLVTNLGRIPPEAYTRDGLATACYRPTSEPGVAMIIAQARGVRDTMNITVY